MSLFRSEKRADTHWVECPKKIDGVAMKQFEALSPLWMQAGAGRFLFDFSATESIQHGALRVFLAFFSELEEQGKAWGSIGLNDALVQQLRGQGVLQKFKLTSEIA